jgi:hypothetical protein
MDEAIERRVLRTGQRLENYFCHQIDRVPLGKALADLVPV